MFFYRIFELFPILKMKSAWNFLNSGALEGTKRAQLSSMSNKIYPYQKFW